MTFGQQTGNWIYGNNSFTSLHLGIIYIIYLFESLLLSLKFKRFFIDEKKKHSSEEITTFPLITIQLPIFNEKYVVKRLIECISEMDYPKDRFEIQILDDSTDETKEISAVLAERYRKIGIDISHIHRTDRSGYKAGALKEGLVIAKGEFIAIFDADFLPKKDFLKETIKYFTDDNIG